MGNPNSRACEIEIGNCVLFIKKLIIAADMEKLKNKKTKTIKTIAVFVLLVCLLAADVKGECFN